MVLKTFYTILKNSFNWIILKMYCGVTINEYNHMLIICKNVCRYIFQGIFFTKSVIVNLWIWFWGVAPNDIFQPFKWSNYVII